MRSRDSVFGLAALAIASLFFVSVGAATEPSPGGKEAPKPKTFALTGPFVHDNLAIFLIHGTDRLKGKSYLTLQEAMEKQIVIVRETGNVNELSIENVSPGSAAMTRHTTSVMKTSI